MPKAIEIPEPTRPTIHSLSRASFVPPPAIPGSSSASVPSPAIKPLPEQPLSSQRSASSSDVPNAVAGGKRHTDPKPAPWTRTPQPDSSAERSVGWPSVEQLRRGSIPEFGTRRDVPVDVAPASITTPRPVAPARPSSSSGSVRPVSPFSQPPVTPETSRGRRAQDDFSYQPVSSYSDPPQRTSESLPESSTDLIGPARGLWSRSSGSGVALRATGIVGSGQTRPCLLRFLLSPPWQRRCSIHGSASRLAGMRLRESSSSPDRNSPR